jgi:hypothetical protein
MLVGVRVTVGAAKFAVTDSGALMVMVVVAEFGFATLPVQFVNV